MALWGEYEQVSGSFFTTMNLNLFEPWSASPRADQILGLNQQQEQGRLPWLLPLRRQRMAASAFSFFRGAAAQMAIDLAQQTNSGEELQLYGAATVKPSAQPAILLRCISALEIYFRAVFLLSCHQQWSQYQKYPHGLQLLNTFSTACIGCFFQWQSCWPGGQFIGY